MSVPDSADTMNNDAALNVDQTLTSDLELDPTDPLSILFNNMSDSESSSQAQTPPDWSQLSSFWSQDLTSHQNDPSNQNTKFPDLTDPFDFSFPMDLDLSTALSMAIEPSALHYNYPKSPSQPMFDMNSIQVQPQDLLASFPFTFSSPTLSTASASTSFTDAKSPRMSVSSGSSVMVPISSGTDPFSGAVMQAKLPIPRLISSIPALPSSRPPKHKPEPQHYVSSSPSSSPSPGPTTPTSDSGASAHNTQSIAGAAVMGRPKTSHTTIERRYRTNLNARIQSLKASVPALRVLDQNTTLEGDVVDERGYIDGVKVARKGSKANVLGKAVEYIRVLKRREIRLKREQEGLRTLILGIPGAEPLLAEWDHEWAKKFGGPERDEIDNEAEAYEGSDDEDGDGEDEGDDSERARKKPKLTKAPTAKKDKNPSVPAAPVADGLAGTVAEKRKRGRPRKIRPSAPPTIAPAAPVLLSNPVGAPVQGDVNMQASQPQQYLLAVFALFSFFNSPFTSTSAAHPHTHQGSVLSHVTADSTTIPTTASWSWNSIIQAIHLFASVLVLITIVVPWLPLPRQVQRAKIMRLIPFSSFIYGQAALSGTHQSDEPLSPPHSPDISDSESDGDSTSTEGNTRAQQSKGPLSDALAQRGSQDEREALIDALGLTTGTFGAVRSLFTRRTVTKSSELERRAWVRLAELVALQPSSAPTLLRLQTYLRLSSLLRASGRSANYACNLATLALLAHSLPLFYVHDRSQRLWNRARAQMVGHYERLVLETLSLEDAAQTLASTPPATALTPLGALATTLIHQRLRSHTSDLFVHTVTLFQDGGPSLSEERDQRETRWRETVNAGRSLGGSIALAADSFAKVWESGVLSVKDLVVDDEDIRTVLSTIVLFKRIFPSRILCCDGAEEEVSFILSPPPSPPVRGPQREVVLELRRALGESVFEEGSESEGRDELEDARDRAVDMLVEYERRGRSRV
ncbi:hypothetical protein K503DRAFT_715705 [Rhizopogon vinicolor AM-OR11-026]|uniref:BHLH domain-containing protein n=1 Tax=Rhizopogon vinicolor AM-OR11-026 TaxID=1314800 RepID=A0A1B7N4P7_9AGAM|nr:hypothetical protein K503DRAFT_715705 [Rhizopogon vinicolor AM-OR11-026]